MERFYKTNSFLRSDPKYNGKIFFFFFLFSYNIFEYLCHYPYESMVDAFFKNVLGIERSLKVNITIWVLIFRG